MPQKSRTDYPALNDLTTFARLEYESHDIEPWALVLRALTPLLGKEGAAWAVKLYNAYDDLGSAFKLFSACSGPGEWPVARRSSIKELAASLTIGRERRNLFGGRIVDHLDSYVTVLNSQPQNRWLREPILPGYRVDGFDSLMRMMRREVWGTGRLAAFEWAEFTGKVLSIPIEAGHGCLWESSGPRESLERIFNGGDPAPDPEWLDEHAYIAKMFMSCRGAPLEWWDVETVICDFNVMRKGRYYPGKHLAMICDEIEGVEEPWRGALRKAFNKVIPDPWREVPPGVNKSLAASYKLDGKIRTPFGGIVSHDWP